MPAETLTVTLSGGARGSEARLPGWALELVPAHGKPSRAPLGLKHLTVGHSPECDLWCADESLSRVHAEVTLGPDGPQVKDLGSKNGVFLGDVRVYEVLLVPGLQLKLGRSRLQLVETKSTTVPLSKTPRFGDALGSSLASRALFARLERAAATDEPILLVGESGTGKDVLARAVHDFSPRREGPFVVVDCGGLAGALIEGELFGHAKGAFTGAQASRVGLLELASGGTVFLDEIGELPAELQPRLLRALENGEVRPVGSNAYVRFDARVIAATHPSLKSKLQSGGFRSDLYFRLAVVELAVPPLRERPEDIPLLVESFLSRLEPPRRLVDLPPGALEQLKAYGWPGNVRELKNAVSRLALFEDAGGAGLELVPASATALHRLPLRAAREQAVSDFERAYLVAVLKENAGKVTAAAKAMGISRQMLHRLMSRYDVRVKDA